MCSRGEDVVTALVEKRNLSSTDYESCVDLQQSVQVHPSAIDPEQQTISTMAMICSVKAMFDSPQKKE